MLVNEHTLIPRPETETLVEWALSLPLPSNEGVLDLGTGSGAIAISIAAERLMCTVTATDVSPEALAVARENARQADLANIVCLEGSWTAPVAGQRFHVIVSNPPYVRSDDAALADLRFEPISALASGADGLDDIRILATDSIPILAPEGWLMMEHGADQQDDVAAILQDAGWTDITCHNDLAGKPRVTVARRNGK